jgi:transposase
MPKTKLSAKQEAQKQLEKLIRMYIYANGTNIMDCAKRLGMSHMTLYSRMARPETFTLSELRLLQRVLGIPMIELADALEAMF